MTRVGIVIALRAEAQALARTAPRAGGLRELPGGVLLAVSGMGAEAARSAADALVSAHAGALAACGVAGALAGGLATGAVVVPERVLDETGRWDADPSWAGAIVGALAGVTTGALLSVSDAVTTPAAKEAVRRSSGAVAVDMESAAVAAVAARHGLPFVAVRVVLDRLADTVPDVLLTGGPAGPGPLAVLGGLLRRPDHLPAVLAIARRYGRALAGLRRVGRALGPQLALPSSFAPAANGTPAAPDG